MLRKTGILTCALVAALSLAAGAQAQEGGPGSTRSLMTYVRVKPAMLINQVEQSVLKRLPDLSY